MKKFVLNKYLINEFLKSFLNVVLLFIALGLIMNLFEEINFFRQFGTNIWVPIGLSLMVIPSMLIALLPFIIFLSSQLIEKLSSHIIFGITLFPDERFNPVDPLEFEPDVSKFPFFNRYNV